MVNVDNVRLTADLLERCCVGVEAMRRKDTSDSARRQDLNLRKIDLERKLMENKCLDENKLEMSQALLVTKLQVSKNQLEQVAGTTSTKGQDVEEEVKTLHIYRRDLIQEICDIDKKISQKAAVIKGKVQTNQCSREEQADKDVLAGLKELSRHNLDKLRVEQKMLEDILEATKIYASTLLHYKSIYEKQLIEAKQMVEELEYGALSRQARTVTISRRKNGSYGNIKDEPMDVEYAKKDDEDDRLEVSHAEKIVILESVQTCLNDTLEVERRLTLLKNVEQNDLDQSKNTAKGLKSQNVIAVPEEFGDRGSTRGSDLDSGGKNVKETDYLTSVPEDDIDHVIDSVIEEALTKSLI